MMKTTLTLTLCFLWLIPNHGWSAQTDWNDGDDMSDVRAALKGNDTELYAADAALAASLAALQLEVDNLETGGASLTTIDESTTLSTSTTQYTFTGAGVVATEPGDEGEIVVTIDGTSGSGDVSGPASATDEAFPRYDGTGTLLQDGQTTEDDTGNIVVVGTVTSTGITTDPGSNNYRIELPANEIPWDFTDKNGWEISAGLLNFYIDGVRKHVGDWAEISPTAGDITTSGSIASTGNVSGGIPGTSRASNFVFVDSEMFGGVVEITADAIASFDGALTGNEFGLIKGKGGESVAIGITPPTSVQIAHKTGLGTAATTFSCSAAVGNWISWMVMPSGQISVEYNGTCGE